MRPQLAYLAFQDIKTTMVGVINKISDQAKAMANLFPSFKCYVIGNHDDALLNLLPKHDYVKLISIPLKSKKNVLQLIKFRKKEAQIALNLFIAEPPLYLYFRYPLGCPWMLSLMKKFSSLGIRTITEHQSFEEKELLALKKFHFWASEFFFGRHCLSYAYGVVGVTEEITAYQKKRAPHAKALCIPNGIDTSKFPFRKSLSSNPYQRLDMLFVGSLANWHGLDRLIRGMKEKRNNCFLHIVGDGSEKEQLQNITSSLGLEQNVFFYGFKNNKEIDFLYQKCHFAISSLSLYRKGLNQASPLKAREYAARGMPFILGYDDPDFCCVPWVYKVRDAQEKPVSLDPIIEWCINCLPKHSPKEIHDYATRFVDNITKTKEILRLMKNVRN